ncbi:ubiquitin-like small modifier protein 1 [Streptomyces microflavus]|uniref:ubiquitin-like small modifier protein 1 n=1 Tax=Streptomyces TaxID=1883 RepID=UPI000517289D|nr:MULTISPECIES: ubiquitin-like small modifier protein 1 [Streptomyces]MDX2976807.1 MoaD/ThiS family protein [Streptomyces sp. NRRL_B-2249]GGX45880.1 molybdopterin synthase sulfur carrier subunit [Streptomyces microflavus]SCK19719.1 molybdopterin synthase subunit MoaD [Streptomyces sp. ScaeMP-e48]
MPITVRVPNILRQYTDDRASVPAEGKTVAEVIAHLEENHPGISQRILDENGSMRRYVNIYVNDNDVRFKENLHTAVPDGAEVSILPGVAGGCC